MLVGALPNDELDEEDDVGDDDERRRENGSRLVFNDEEVPLELPHCVRVGVRVHEHVAAMLRTTCTMV